MIGMMLPHVRDPFSVLEQAAARSSGAIIVTQPAPRIPDAYAYFMPNPSTRKPHAAWWSTSEICVERMLAVLGFDVVSRTRAEHAWPARGDREACMALIAARG
jgi:hypothetical protein